MAKHANPTTKKTAKTNGATDTDVTIHVILDRSGSMAEMKAATIEGFSAFLSEQAKLPGARFSLTQFDSQGIDYLYVDTPVEQVKLLTDATYVPRGGTPLYDAVGQGIRALEAAEPKGKVVFVVMTDGINNASREYTREDVFEIVNKKQVKSGWEFVFLGAGVDAYEAGSALGVAAASTYGYAATPAAQRHAFASLSRSTRAYRTGEARSMVMPDEPVVTPKA